MTNGLHSVREWNAHRHRLRVDPLYRAGHFDVARHEEHFADCERRRQGQLVGIPPIRIVIEFTMKEIEQLFEERLPIPLDLVPHGYWHPEGMDYPAFSEEALGSEF